MNLSEVKSPPSVVWGVSVGAGEADLAGIQMELWTEEKIWTQSLTVAWAWPLTSDSEPIPARAGNTEKRPHTHTPCVTHSSQRGGLERKRGGNITRFRVGIFLGNACMTYWYYMMPSTWGDVHKNKLSLVRAPLSPCGLASIWTFVGLVDVDEVDRQKGLVGREGPIGEVIFQRGF